MLLLWRAEADEWGFRSFEVIMYFSLSVFASCLLVFGLTSACAGEASAPTWLGPTFLEASGACQGRPGGPLWGTALSWDRHDLHWHACEPRPGEWDDAYLKQFGERVLAQRKAGVTVLPVLGYNASWSWDRSQRVLVYGKMRRTFVPLGGDRFELLTETQNGKGAWLEEKREAVEGTRQWPLAAEHVAAWEAYVRRSVAFLMAPPYNLTTFQIWNEAHPVSGFWEGDLDTYMTRVHLPAARVIRELGGTVVYGGWPCCGSLKELTALLDKHKAWSMLDVVDVHYFGLNAFEHLRREAADRGFPKMGVWQTEVCFDTQPTYVSTVYPRFLAWALQNGWKDQPDRYKLFFFAYWSPDDPKAFGYRKTLLSSERLSPHGESLRTLGALFGCKTIRIYTGVRSDPALPMGLDGRSSALEAFEVGKRIIIAVQWVDGSVLSRESLKLILPDQMAGEVAGVERWEAVGWRRTLEFSVAGGSGGQGIEITVPILDRTDFRCKVRDSDCQQHGLYVVVTRK